ncbi:hypothetical protein [Devosia sp.]|jgi:hypothetical protein|uniref:hypothetical protein n=1 Tax=Devosia sp. TaxID=1871048 RepID=UPI003EEA75E8
MIDGLLKFVTHPYPHRVAFMRLIKKLELGSYPTRLRLGAVDRPYYGYIVWNAAVLAQKLGYPRVSLIEFGVATGNGLLNLEYHAREASKFFNVEFEIYGFDTGTGLPPPADYRDLPYVWREQLFKMDFAQLSSKLTTAKLVIGDIRETLPNFAADHKPAPIGAVVVDTDYFSSTKATLEIFDLPKELRLPRVFCYLDDVIGNSLSLYSEYTAELLAVEEFNKAHDEQKIAVSRNLIASATVVEPWHSQIYIHHDFTHPHYATYLEEQKTWW